MMHDGNMNPADRTRWICERARDSGFDLCGVGRVDAEGLAFRELEHLPDWLARGYAGEMNYLRDPRRVDPRLALEGARSVIVVAMNYNTPQPRSVDQRWDAEDQIPHGWISRYAWGDDYHEVLREKLNALVASMRAEFPEPFEARAHVDTGPVIERIAAKCAGLGWLAKNTMLINQQLGSWLFLGVILTTIELTPSLAPGEAPAADLCGSCTRCLDACPTQAFPQPYVLDARRCISYLTIELRGPIPEELRAGMGNAAIGCDICQDVCPWNRKAPVTQLAAFQPRQIPAEATNVEVDTENGTTKNSGVKNDSSLFAPELEWLASLSQQEFSAAFRGSALKRAKWRGMVRNACIALGNAKIAPDSPSRARISRLLKNLASGEDALIAEHARWALLRLGVETQSRPSS
jgi:epoxyqueuosine reductase